ncbi:hypothetical protein [Desulfonema magnum]|uniref:Uncharacterized protein n=1 Tax=Desulfonema magnum TaxID=45655 RepID=A0A975GSH2_9BACT|nr:hypothetical protein [Desulfonema magnum]QTA92055.1 Uncharacterized protein dnm_081290 [Desulfonema magnum]
MSSKAYIKSDAFRLFLDEPLRRNACEAVEKFLDSHAHIDNVQLHSIPSVIQGGGTKGFKDLVENQKKKNTKAKNKKFWEFLDDLVFASPGPEFSLRSFIRQQSGVQELLRDETRVSEKREQKQIRKANRALVDEIMKHVLPIYFEHFNCHYFYMNR